MFEAIFIITLIVLIVGSITDIKTREVPDWVSFSAIAAGFGLRGIDSVLYANYNYITDGLTGFVFFFILACTLYYLGQWGGGDSKMIMALGALIGLKFELTSLMAGFVLNLLFIGGIYGMLWCIGIAFVNWKSVHREFSRINKDRTVKILKFITYILSLAIIFAAILSGELRFVFLVLAGLLMALFHSWIIIKAVEKKGMIKKRAVSKLTEGDWVVKEVRHDGKYLCGPKDLGLTKAQISLLKKFKIRAITIKEGIPFVPGFLITFIVTYLYGNLMMYII